MAYTVYADVLWLVNFGMDIALLWATGRFGGFVFGWGRGLLAAGLGAFYGVGLVYPALAPLYIMPLPLLFSLLLLRVGFGRLPLRRFIVLALCFYVVSFCMGGAALAARALLARYAAGHKLIWLLPALLLAAGLAALGVGWWRRQLWQNGQIVRAELAFAGRRLSLPCFLDSGNRLREPASGRPVLLAEFAAAAALLPPALAEALAAALRENGDTFRPQEIWRRFASCPWGGRLVLLPYRTVGEAGRLTLGFLPDEAAFYLADGRKIEPEQTPLLAFGLADFGGLAGARAIIAPEAVFGGNMPYDNIWEERLEA